MDEKSEIGSPTRRGMLVAAAGLGVAPTTLRPDQEVNMAAISPVAAPGASEGTQPFCIRVLPDGAVRVQVSPQVMFNLGASVRTLTSVMAQLGHPGCTSGFNLQFVLQEQQCEIAG